jgi:hypothetical protein
MVKENFFMTMSKRFFSTVTMAALFLSGAALLTGCVSVRVGGTISPLAGAGDSVEDSIKNNLESWTSAPEVNLTLETDFIHVTSHFGFKDSQLSSVSIGPYFKLPLTLWILTVYPIIGAEYFVPVEEGRFVSPSTEPLDILSNTTAWGGAGLKLRFGSIFFYADAMFPLFSGANGPFEVDFEDPDFVKSVRVDTGLGFRF